jgi:hypothetical protein
MAFRVHQLTISTERLQLVGEISAWLAQLIGTAFHLCFLDRIRYFFILIASQLTSRGQVYPLSDHLLYRKSGRVMNRSRDLGTCSQELRH